MFVQDLHIYPVKSLGGIRVKSALALQRGFQFDRRLMLTDTDGSFITQRVYHQLSLLQTQLDEDGIVITHKKDAEQQTRIPFYRNGGESTTVSVWDDTVEALHLNEDIDEWFSNFLQFPCKLVYLPENGIRPVDTRYAEQGEQVSFADAFPYLLIGQASLDDLNSRLDIPVPMNRFRPSIVVTGSSAFEEDTWKEIRIGEVRFKVAKPCARCILTTVDQETGIRGKEPLYTLSKYRTTNNKVLFGQNLIALNEGLISENDPVEILLYKD
ncbi:MOSC domain-containing protein [Pararcticibacter amylolyticus]|uniref:MOSC domain-containing protein n=1 Tax=Pararcticibacter amylolyticus TaxID=2173175 RepID=A0A2U2PA18_9SPHI|nr:MOSC domain-containing protein [Pararcticibacter amylolyticus]PWG78144.1 MOSC domain-containing protein [Pararcticibacter amylolyticus]